MDYKIKLNENTEVDLAKLIVCPNCKKEFNKRYRTKYCSMECYLMVARENPNRGCFKKGNRPFNKGTKGIIKKNKTSFKIGDMPHNYKPLKSIEIRNDKCGTQRKFIKIKEPKTWITYAKYVWLKSGKKIKKGYVIAHKDCNSLNDNLDNLICISKSELPKFFNKWNTKNTILNNVKTNSYRYKRRLWLNATDFINGKRKPQKVSECIKIYCDKCRGQIKTCVKSKPQTTIRQRLDIFIKAHNKIIHLKQ